MLLLERKEGQTIVLTLPDKRVITIYINQVRRHGHKVRLAVDAPPNIKILRGELVDETDHD